MLPPWTGSAQSVDQKTCGESEARIPLQSYSFARQFGLWDIAVDFTEQTCQEGQISFFVADGKQSSCTDAFGTNILAVRRDGCLAPGEAIGSLSSLATLKETRSIGKHFCSLAGNRS
jgi:hypothetical protein